MSKIKDEEIILRTTNNGCYIVEDDRGVTAHTSLEDAVVHIGNSINNKRWRIQARLIQFEVFISEKVMPREAPPETVDVGAI